jgi:toxin ParE1/3/4
VKLARQPGIGRPAQVQGGDARCFPFKSYLIFYLPLDNRVTILRVIHGARNIEQAVKD